MKVINRGDFMQISATKKSLTGFLCNFASYQKHACKSRGIRLQPSFQLLIYPCNNRIQRKRYDTLQLIRNLNMMKSEQESLCREFCAYLFWYWSVCALDVPFLINFTLITNNFF